MRKSIDDLLSSIRAQFPPAVTEKLSQYEIGRKLRREKLSQWRRDNPEKTKAHQVLNYCVEKGTMIRPLFCEHCGRSGIIEAHHDDYTEPLKVRWLCKSCHTYANKKMLFPSWK